jgi:hypothetical protein
VALLVVRVGRLCPLLDAWFLCGLVVWWFIRKRGYSLLGPRNLIHGLVVEYRRLKASKM